MVHEASSDFRLRLVSTASALEIHLFRRRSTPFRSVVKRSCDTVDRNGFGLWRVAKGGFVVPKKGGVASPCCKRRTDTS